ncbi:hypothetical protein HSBAA_50170 [Vreelandella sulfidaeris]|uniref:PAC domain-containing protein n=1 Tax=Vreelandella sulfidaeris TaxID=115553 RepID=A0A455UGF6_9GAMM|nr:hypothetical protein HSBAA_50170 [Halomonas sulfidaeris]
MGYTLKEIAGQHHRMFCDVAETATQAYQDFWRALASGESRQGTFRRINAQGSDIWLEATYLPIKNRRGSVISILKIANDITAAHQEAERKMPY